MNPTERILIVDDDSLFRKEYERVLGQEGYVVDTASDRKTALEQLDRQAWDVVLLDQRLQGPEGPDDGLGLIAEVTRRSPGALTMVVTGYPNKDRIEQAFADGVYDYVIKDEFFRTFLRAKIRNALQYTRERRLGPVEPGALEAELGQLWQQVEIETDRHRKGKLLEDLMVVFFKLIPGFEKATPRRRNEREEIDVLVRNESTDVFWQKEGSYLLVECKNWSTKVGVSELRDFMGKMQARYDRCRLGLFVAPGGFSEPLGEELRSAKKTNQLVIAVDRAGLAGLIQAKDKNEEFKALLERAMQALNGNGR